MSKALKFVAACRLPTEWGEFTMHGFEEEGGQEHVALTMGDVSDGLLHDETVEIAVSFRVLDRRCFIFGEM